MAERISRRRLATFCIPPVVVWLLGLGLTVTKADRDVILAVAVPLTLICGTWAVTVPANSLLLKLYPAITAAGLLLPGGAGGVVVFLAWIWFWTESSRIIKSTGFRAALGMIMAWLFFSPFWVRALWPQGGGGAALSAYGGPILVFSTGFLAHGGSYDPRTGILYGMWYGTDYPVVSPEWWRFAALYALGAGLTIALRSAASRLAEKQSNDNSEQSPTDDSVYSLPQHRGNQAF